MSETNYYQKGRALRREGKTEAARQCYQSAVESGDPKGYYGLALIAEDAGASKEILNELYRDCFDRIKRIALQGDALAASIIGIYYGMGLGGIAQDQEQAHLWLLIGANGGDEVAQFNLAVQYYLGDGAQQNLNSAMDWLQKAIQKHYTPAIDLYNEIHQAQQKKKIDKEI